MMAVEMSRLARAAVLAIKRGDIVSRISDPVHVGQVTSIVITSEGRKATVRWFPHMIGESGIMCSDLQLAEEWK